MQRASRAWQCGRKRHHQQRRCWRWRWRCGIFYGGAGGSSNTVAGGPLTVAMPQTRPQETRRWRRR
ncbi:hypothetical protein I552_10268 [Mycobacterium xenopi 3993]|nr:hypothetical protein I552_10268 [Mycobacterium xenopi 3993]